MKTKPEIRQPLFLLKGVPQDARQLLPADIERVREGLPICPVCREAGRIDLAEGIPLFVHRASHQVETPLRRDLRETLGRWLHGALPGSTVRKFLPWREGHLDLGLVRSDGARAALHIFSEDPRLNEMRSLQEDLHQEGTALLLILDPSRLPVDAWDEDREVLSVNFRRAESEMLRTDHPLLYLHPRERRIVLVEPPSEVFPLLQEKRNLGKTGGRLHHYRLSELGLRDGRWFLDRSFDLLGENPRISKPLRRRLRKLSL